MSECSNENVWRGRIFFRYDSLIFFWRERNQGLRWLVGGMMEGELEAALQSSMHMQWLTSYFSYQPAESAFHFYLPKPKYTTIRMGKDRPMHYKLILHIIFYFNHPYRLTPSRYCSFCLAISKFRPNSLKSNEILGITNCYYSRKMY